MYECWLKTNRQALLVAAIVPGLLATAGAALLLTGYAWAGGPWFYAGAALAAVGSVLVAALLYAMRIPRLAYEDGHLLVYLRTLTPFRVPIDIVEVFFVGQGPAHPVEDEADTATTRNVVVRLAESAPQWHQRDVRSDLGQWCDGYIIIRGTWCEPLSLERVNQINHRLAEIRRQRRASQQQETG